MPKRHVRRRRRRAPSEFSANVAYLHFAIVATLELQSGRYPPLLTFSVSPLRGKKIHCNLWPEEDRERESDRQLENLRS